MDMPCSNTAALRKHEAEQDKLDRNTELFAERALEELIDEFMEGNRHPLRLNLADVLMDTMDAEDIALALAGFICSSERNDYALDVEKRVKPKLKEWLENSALLGERIAEIADED